MDAIMNPKLPATFLFVVVACSPLGCAVSKNSQLRAATPHTRAASFQVTRLRASEFLFEACIPRTTLGEPEVKLISNLARKQHYLIQANLHAEGDSDRYWRYTALIDPKVSRAAGVLLSLSIRHEFEPGAWSTEEYDLIDVVTEFENRGLILDSSVVSLPCERTTRAGSGHVL
jgi:hypothetical protein